MESVLCRWIEFFGRFCPPPGWGVGAGALECPWIAAQFLCEEEKSHNLEHVSSSRVVWESLKYAEFTDNNSAIQVSWENGPRSALPSLHPGMCACVRGEGCLGVRRKLSCLMIQGNLRECSPPLPSLKWRHSSEDSVEEPHSHSQQFPVRWRVHRKGLRLNSCSKWRLLSCSHVVEKYRNQAKSN